MSNFRDIDRIYATAASAAKRGWEVVEVPWKSFRFYHDALKGLEASVREHDLLEEWAVVLSFCKRIRFFLATTPLSPAVLIREVSQWKTVASPSLESLLRQAPENLRAHVAKTQEAFASLEKETDNPLWKHALQDIVSRDHGGAWVGCVCTETRLMGPIQEILDPLAENGISAWAIRPTELKANQNYGQLVVLGPTTRYVREGTDFIFKCPRAKILTLFTPEIFPARIPNPHDLLGSPAGSSREETGSCFTRFAPPRIRKTADEDRRAEDGAVEGGAPDTEKEWVESLPQVVINYTPPSQREGDSSDKDSEPVSARQTILTADHVVFLPAGGSANRLIVDLEDKTCTAVEHVEVEEIGADDVLVFSAEGGGDMVAEVADQLLGDEVVWLRNLQRSWKSELGAKVARHGLREVARQIGALGSKISSPANLRYWCSMWNIGPGTWRSFEAILEYCGLESRKDEIFHATEMIRKAHRRAGFELSSRLSERMIGESFDQLYLEGRQEFGGSPSLPNRKVAFLVVEISHHTRDVSPCDLLHPFEIRQNSWR